MQQGEVMAGVDVSGAQLDVALWPGGESFRVGNDAQGVRRRRQLTGMLVAETNRHQRATKVVKKSTVATIRSLKRTLAELERQLRDTVKNSPAQQAKATMLEQVPGVGPQLARTLIAEVPELGRLGRRQLAALIGVAPHAHESGPFKGRRMIWAGAPPCAARSTWRCSAPPASTRFWRPFIAAFWNVVRARSSRTSPARANCWSFSMPCSANHTTWNPILDFQHSR